MRPGSMSPRFAISPYAGAKNFSKWNGCSSGSCVTIMRTSCDTGMSFARSAATNEPALTPT
jgi:hypothetical protein